MQRLVEVKKRMRAIEDIRNVARTMATVAAAKLSRTRARASGMRIYAGRMRRILRRQQRYLESMGLQIDRVSPFFVERPVRSVLLVLLAGDRGMCGNYNMAVNHLAFEAISNWREKGIAVKAAARGAKAEQYLRRKAGDLELLRRDTWPRAGVTDTIVDELHELATEAFTDGTADEVWCAYTRFYTPIRREPTLVRLLPIAFTEASGPEPGDEDAGGAGDPRLDRWAYEPRFSAIGCEMVSTFVRLQCEDVLLESYASEQGARMITMEEATERAGKKLHECRATFNRLRREFITTDLLSVLFASHVRKREEAQARHERAERSQRDGDRAGQRPI